MEDHVFNCISRFIVSFTRYMSGMDGSPKTASGGVVAVLKRALNLDFLSMQPLLDRVDVGEGEREGA
jgi:hypothetical protein